MNNQSQLAQMSEELIQSIEESEQQEIAISQQQMHRQGLVSQLDCGCDNQSLKAAGLNTKALSDIEEKTSQDDAEAFAKIDAIMAEESALPEAKDTLNIDTSLLPEGSQILTPSWSKVYSDDLDANEMTKGTEVNSQAVIGGGNCKNVWNWARGDGWGCTGGVGQNTQTVYWTFWFKPTKSKFYSIKPRFQFNGYYIAKANDKWYNCKNAQVRVSARTQAYQYNWKHRDSVNLINLNSGSININKRLDDSRFTNYSTLLGKDDWVAIVCSAQLHVRAQGGGSYAKSDFSAGANKVCVPYVVVS